MPVQTPKCLVGIKATNLKKGASAFKTRNCAYVTLRLFIWKSSVHYEALYNEGLIDDSFSYDYTEENNFGFAMVGGDTKQPDELADRLKDILFKTDYDQLDAAALERVKKKNWWFYAR